MNLNKDQVVYTRFSRETKGFIDELAKTQEWGLSETVNFLVKKAVEDAYRIGFNFLIVQALKKKRIEDATPEAIAGLIPEVKAEHSFLSTVLIGLLPEK